MDGLVLLYAITFLPVSGSYGAAVDNARKAALVQSGIDADWRQAASALEHKAPPTLRQAAVVAGVIYRRELVLQYKPITVTASQGAARALFSFGF